MTRNKVAALGYQGIALSGCGWLLPFHIGCYETLREADACPDDIPIAGASGGALVAAGIASGICGDDMMKGLEEVGRWSGKNGVWMKLATPLQQLMNDVLPADAHRRCNGRLHVAVCSIAQDMELQWPLHTETVTEFQSREHLIETCMASSFIPFYLQASPWLKTRSGKRLVDGGLIDIVPVIEGVRTIKSCPYDVIRRVRRDDEDFVTTGQQWSLPQLLLWTLQPPSPRTLADLRDAGRRGASAWLACR